MYLESRFIFWDACPLANNWCPSKEVNTWERVFDTRNNDNDILAIEQAVSIDGYVLDNKRSKLFAKNMEASEATMLLDDWGKKQTCGNKSQIGTLMESDDEELPMRR